MNTHSIRIGVFPGSFDPFTLGHLQIVEQSLGFVDKVLVAVGTSGSKQALLSAEERLLALQETFRGEDRVEAHLFRGLVVQFAKQQGAQFLLRGLRSETDLAYELPMAHTNRSLEPSIQTIFLPTAPERSYISSTLVREVARNGGAFESFVPPAFARLMRDKLRESK
jgi:pantetheine-phosphate adenylyltransferase